MKKLSKLSLLGEMDLLSKAELKQLVGSSGDSDGCTKDNVGSPCVTDPEGQSGTCGYNPETKNYECMVGTVPTKPGSGYYY